MRRFIYVILISMFLLYSIKNIPRLTFQSKIHPIIQNTTQARTIMTEYALPAKSMAS